MKIRNITIIAVLALSSLTAFAQSSSGVASMPTSSTTYVMPFMDMDITGFSASRAGANILQTRTSSIAAYANPGMIPYCEPNFEVGGSFYGTSEQDNNFWYSGYGALKLGKRLGVAVGYSQSSAQEIDIMDNNGVTKGTFESYNRMIRAGLGLKTFEWLSFGATACIANQYLTPDVTLSATAFDVYATGVFVCGLKAAVGATNLGADVENASKVKFPLAGAITSALGFEKTFGSANTWNIDAEVKGDFLAIDALKNGKSLSGCPWMVSAGATIGIESNGYGSSLSAGYHYGSADAPVSSYASVGAGVSVKHLKIGVALLFANQNLDDTIIGTVALSF